jgi:hypothetical protein
MERFSIRFTPDLFARDRFHPNRKAHAIWGEEIAALALPLVGRPPAALARSRRRRARLFPADCKSAWGQDRQDAKRA